MLRAILNKSWRQHPTRHQLYGYLTPITKTIQVKRTRHIEHCWRSKDKLISDVLLWSSTYGQAKAGRPARTYIQQLCEDTGCNSEDLPEAMNNREKWLAARHDDDEYSFKIFVTKRVCNKENEYANFVHTLQLSNILVLSVVLPLNKFGHPYFREFSSCFFLLMNI